MYLWELSERVLFYFSRRIPLETDRRDGEAGSLQCAVNRAFPRMLSGQTRPVFIFPAFSPGTAPFEQHLHRNYTVDFPFRTLYIIEEPSFLSGTEAGAFLFFAAGQKESSSGSS